MPDAYPISGPQQHMWEYLRFLNPAEPGATFMNLVEPLTIRGPLDPVALEAALNEVVRRHGILRTTVVEPCADPLLRTASRSLVALSRVDLRDVAEDRRRAMACAAVAAEDERPFDIVSGPLLRAALYRLSADEHVLVLSFHHLVMDGWSLGVVCRELFACYGAAIAGRAFGLAPPRIQYREYAEGSHGTAEERDRLAAYWVRRLRGVPPPLDLPTDRPRTALRTARYAVHPFTFGEGAGLALARASLRARVTPFVVALAAFTALLHRYTRRTELVVGTVVSTRNDPRTADVPGLFTNVLFVAATVLPRMTFAELTARVWDSFREARRHEAPFTVVAAALCEEFPDSRPWPPHNVFQAWLQFDVPHRRLAALPVAVETFDCDPAAAPSGRGYPVGNGARRRGFQRENPTVELAPDGSGGVVQYNTELFDPATIVAFVADLESLLLDAVDAPERRVCDLRLTG